MIWDDKLFVTSGEPSTATLFVQCLGAATGKLLWQKSFESLRHRVHPQNSFASSTPAVDANHIYVAYANPAHTYLIALDHGGEQVWKRDFGKWVSAHGFGMSPVVVNDKVIFCNSQQGERLRNGQRPGKSAVIAVNAKNGDDVWRTPLVTTRACYALPCLVKIEGQKDQLIGTNTGNGFYSIDPDNGQLNWSVSAFEMRTVASTIFAGGLVFGSNGSGGGGNYTVAIKPNGRSSKKAFEVRNNANYVPTPIAVGDMLFLFGDKGVVSCLDLESGKLHWRKRVSRGFSGSPVATNKHLYAIAQDGTTFVIAADRKFVLVSKIELGEPSRSTPAIANDRIYFRTDARLFALGSSSAKPSDK